MCVFRLTLKTIWTHLVIVGIFDYCLDNNGKVNICFSERWCQCGFIRDNALSGKSNQHEDTKISQNLTGMVDGNEFYGIKQSCLKQSISTNKVDRPRFALDLNAQWLNHIISQWIQLVSDSSDFIIFLPLINVSSLQPSNLIWP